MLTATRTWLIASCSVLWCLALDATGAEQARSMSFRHLTIADGLSQSTVMDVHQDAYGYVWFATENGLDRFDGYRFHRYQRGRPSAGELASDFVWQIVEDGHSNLWLATEGGGVARWDRSSDSFSHYAFDPDDPESLSSNRIRALALTDEGLWVATFDAGLNLLDPGSGRVRRFRHDPADPASLPGDAVFSLLADSTGKLWVGTDSGLAWKRSGSDRFVHFLHDPDVTYSMSSNRVRALHEDQHGAIWVGTLDAGLNVLRARSRRFEHFAADPGVPGSLSNDHVVDILEDDTGNLWVATANGLNLLVPDAERFVIHYGGERVDQLWDSYVMSVYQDRAGVLWVGTRVAGAHTWNSRSWEFGHFNAEWLDQHSASSFASDRTGYWVGTFGGGLKHLDEVTGEVRTISTRSDNPISDDRVMSLLRDHDGGLWVGTMDGGVNWRPAGTRTFEVLRHDPDDSNSLSADGVMSLFEDSDGNLWIGTFGGGVTRFDPVTREYSRFPYDDSNPLGICGTQVRAVAEDHQGGLWFATENGLCVYDRWTSRFHTFKHADDDAASLPHDSVYALLVDRAGRLWAGTGGGGLALVSGSSTTPASVSFRTYTRRDGLSSNVVYGILPGPDGYLWLSGNNGLTRFDPDSGAVRNFRKAHGLQADEFHFGAAHRSADGMLLFGGANGFNRFDPRNLSRNTQPPPLVLTDVTVLNESRTFGVPLATVDEIRLDHDEPAVTFEFAALDFTEPERNRYAYRLDGFDAGWTDAGTRRSATYTNLDSGEYVFRVRAAGASGVWSDTGLEVDLQVAPAPWATPFAYAVYLLALLGALMLLVRAQNRKLAQAVAFREKLEREVAGRTEELSRSNAELQRLGQVKSDFLARMSHEIRSPINGILGMSELLARSRLDPSQLRYARTILSSGQSLLQIINDILDYSKLDSHKLELDPVETSLEDLVDEVADMFASEARRRGLELVTRLPAGGVAPVLADPLRLRQVLINLVDNALKFTERGFVELTVRVVPQDDRASVTFSVSDTGIGIAKDNQARIFDSFSQEDGSTTRRFGGTGLGLAICTELVALMGGELQLESERGHGSTFSFEVELPVLGEPPGDAPRGEINGCVVIAGARERLRDALSEYVRAWHFERVTVASAEAATGLLDRADLLIVDSLLQDRSGQDLLVELQANDTLPRLGALLLQPFGSPQWSPPPGVRLLDEPVKRRELVELLQGMSGVVNMPSPKALRQDEPRLSGRVLLVEDNAVNREVFSGMLNEIGCEVRCAVDGLSGVALVQAESFDAVLMDYQLPDIDGLEATRRIRALSGAGRDVPVVALTANVSARDRELCQEAGMSGFLAKPCRIAELAGELGRWLPVGIPAESDAGADEVQGEFDPRALARIRNLKRPDGSDMLEHAVALFTVSTREALEQIRTAIASADTEALRFAAHKLKSSCANLGVAGMAGVCRRLEELGRSGTLGDAEQLLEEAEQHFAGAAGWLREQLRESA